MTRPVGYPTFCAVLAASYRIEADALRLRVSAERLYPNGSAASKAEIIAIWTSEIERIERLAAEYEAEAEPIRELGEGAEVFAAP